MPRSSKRLASAIEPVAGRAPLHVIGLSWLSDSALLLVGTQLGDAGPMTSGSLCRESLTAPLLVRAMVYPHPNGQSSKGTARWVAVLQGSGRLRGRTEFSLTLSDGVETWTVPAASVSPALKDLRTLVRSQLTALGPRERRLVVELVVSSLNDLGGDTKNRLRLSRSSNLVRDMLRERLPICDLRPNRIEGLAVETVISLDDVSFYVEGWLCDGESDVSRMTAVSPEGSRTEILGNLFRYRRPDTEEFFKSAIGDKQPAKYGFISHFRVTAPSLLPNGWLIEVETAAGSEMEAAAPHVVTNDERIRIELLNDLAHDIGLDQELRRRHIAPSLAALQSRRSRSVRIDVEKELGDQPADPQVSILVPLFRRVDLLEHQMAQFADDPELRSAELIYVLDSPELKSELLTLADGLFRLYRLPFKVVVLSENSGFSTANNIGASRARGQTLLLLNSDVVPASPGWLSKLIGFYHGLEKPGAVGPKLIYEDSSLQHAGLYFDLVPGTDMWMNEHFYKGLYSDLPAANVTRVVPAVTGACLMIDARLYASVGGLSGTYIQGDYEDSDLCLRLNEAGRKNWYYPEVVLYHLEGQSYPTT